jgi:predicted Zn-dependent peptidase
VKSLERGSKCMLMGVKVPRLTESEAIHLQVLRHLLVGSSSRFRNRLDPILCEVSAVQSPPRSAGLLEFLFLLNGGVRGAEGIRILETLFKEFQRVQKGRISESELKLARSLAQKELEEGAMLTRIAEDTAVFDFLGLKSYSFQWRAEQLSSTTCQDLQRFALKYLSADRTAVVFS